MVFVYRAAFIAFATFASVMGGFGLHILLPASYLVETKGMLGSVVGLVGSLLSLVLSLLIWTSHSQFTTQQSQLQIIGRSIVRLDFALSEYGAVAAPGQGLLREHLKRVRARLWEDDADTRRLLFHGALPDDVQVMRGFLSQLGSRDEEQKQHLATAKDLFNTIVETQVTMIRSPFNQVPTLLLNVVFGWSCVLFFGFGLLSQVNAVTTLLAALGATCVGSAIFLILELSDPYSGVFRMSHDGFDRLMQTMTEESVVFGNHSPERENDDRP